MPSPWICSNLLDKGVTVVIREEGKIVREALYYDTADLYRQLGHVQ